MSVYSNIKIVYTYVLRPFSCSRKETVWSYRHKCKQKINFNVQHLLLSFSLPHVSVSTARVFVIPNQTVWRTALVGSSHTKAARKNRKHYYCVLSTKTVHVCCVSIWVRDVFKHRTLTFLKKHRMETGKKKTFEFSDTAQGFFSLVCCQPLQLHSAWGAV